MTLSMVVGATHINQKTRKCPTDMLTGQTDGGNFWRKSFFFHVCSDLYQFDENCNIALLVNLDIQKHYSKS